MTFSLGSVILRPQEEVHPCDDEVRLIKFCLVLPCVAVNYDNLHHVLGAPPRAMSGRRARPGGVSEDGEGFFNF